MASTPKIERQAVLAMLRHLQRSGVSFLPTVRPERVAELARGAAVKSPNTPIPAIAKPGPIPPASPIAKPVTRDRLAPIGPPHPATARERELYPGEPLSAAQREQHLSEIADEISSCVRCPMLVQSRRHAVPGGGDPMARVCFISDSPSAEEDVAGTLLVGSEGQLLSRMIVAAQFKLEDVFILNTIRCRPPASRNASFEEIENCRQYLDRQLNIVRPEYIVCLGLVAAQTILNSKLTIGRLRNQFHWYRESKVLVTYHPAQLLRDPEFKKAAWADLQHLMRDLGITPPAKS